MQCYKFIIKEDLFIIKEDSKPKYFLEVTKGMERLQQNALDKLRFSDFELQQV